MDKGTCKCGHPRIGNKKSLGHKSKWGMIVCQDCACDNYEAKD